MSELVGKEIGAYRVVSRIRTGGMGEVYLAEHQTLGKKVAVKTLPPKLAEDKEFVSRFHEAQVMAELTHPHLVQVHDAGELEGVYYFVMDYVAGPDDAPCDLHVHRHAQAAGRLPEKRVRDWAIQIADALAYIHERGVIHRDLKPANILIDAHGNAKLTDFGLAKVIGSEFIRTHVAERIQHTLDSVRTETGGDSVRPADTLDDVKTRMSGADSRSSTASGVRGTPDYMAPEQRATGGEIDQRTDIYAFGVTVFHLLTGQLPGRRTNPALVVPGLMKGWGAILKRCLAPDASDRYESAAALLEGLRALRPRPRWPVPVGLGVAVVVVGVAIWAIPQIIVGGSEQITTQPVDGNDQSQLVEQVPVDFTRVDHLQQRARALQENGEPIEALGVYAEALEAVDGLLESHPENELVAERRKEVDEEKSAVLREARELASEQKQAGDEFVEAARKARRAETYVENIPKALEEYDAASRMVGQILEHAPGDDQTQRLRSAISEAQLEAFRETRRFARDHSESGVRRIAEIREARTPAKCTGTIDAALGACAQALQVADTLEQAGDERGYSETLRADLRENRRMLLDGLRSHAEQRLDDIERALDEDESEEALLLCDLAEAIAGKIPEEHVDFDKTAFLNKVVTLRGAVLNASEKEEQYKTLYLEAQKASLEHDYDECVKYAERAQNVKRTPEVDQLIQTCTYQKNLAEGQALEEKCDLENAVRAYERASQALPHYREGRDALHRAQGKWDSQQKAENLLREGKNLEQPPTLENFQKALTKYEDGLSYARCPDTTQEIQDRVESVKARIRQVQLREKTSLTVDVDVDLSDWYHNTGVKSLKVWVDERIVKDVKKGKVAIDPWSENVSPGSYTIRIQTTCWYQRRVAGRGGRSATGFHPPQNVSGEASRTVTVALGEAKTVLIKVKGKTKGKWHLDVTISD